MGFCADPCLDPETHVSDIGEMSSAHSWIVEGRMQAIRDYVKQEPAPRTFSGASIGRRMNHA
jgi:hypothetical protein